MLKETLAALALAVLSALLLRLLPEEAEHLLNDGLISPVFGKLTAVISAVATPLVFFGVISGITGIGSSSAVGSMGKKLLVTGKELNLVDENKTAAP